MKICIQCGKDISKKLSPSHINRGEGKFCSRLCCNNYTKNKPKKNKKDAKYNALHSWVRKWKPKSMFCEKCGRVTDKLDAANISGEYKRDISDYRWLCKKCHRQEHIKNPIFNKHKILADELMKRRKYYSQRGDIKCQVL